jgi:hypothetical protein
VSTHDPVQNGVPCYSTISSKPSRAQVVRDYVAICETISELATHEQTQISTTEFQILDRALDRVIALAISAYQKGRERIIVDDVSKQAFFAHELCTHLSSAMMVFDAIRKSEVPCSHEPSTPCAT